MTIDRPTEAAALVSALLLALFAATGGREAFLGVLVYLVLPWMFLIYPDELGGWAYGTPGTHGTGVNRPTPGRFVYIVGWLLLLAPAMFYLAVFV